MNEILNSEYEKYLIYPNESIDKLTVNRTFERLFEAIDSKAKSSSLTVDTATVSSYGKAKFSSDTSYSFDKPDGDDSDYNSSMLNIAQLRDMSKRISNGSSESLYAAPVSSNGTQTLSVSGNRYWVKSDYMDSKFVFMPNGINTITCSFNIGFNGLAGAIGDDSIIDSDVISPLSLSSYGDTINIDKESYWNIEDFVNDNNGIDGLPDSTDVRNLIGMDGRSMDIPFMETVNVTLRHNNCSSTKYSAYRQSYIELCMSMKLSVKSLFERKYGKRTYETITDSSSISGYAETNIGEPNRKFRLFTQKPMVMAQIGFFNNESNPKPLFGFDNGINTNSEQLTSRFSSHSQLSQKPLDEVDIDGNMVSPLNGSVLVKRVDNIYDRDGNITDNIISIDIIMKFMAGSASDPEMEYAMKNLNSRSRVQLAMIGV